MTADISYTLLIGVVCIYIVRTLDIIFIVAMRWLYRVWNMKEFFRILISAAVVAGCIFYASKLVTPTYNVNIEQLTMIVIPDEPTAMFLAEQIKR
jgi:hypothetical protein